MKLYKQIKFVPFLLSALMISACGGGGGGDASTGNSGEQVVPPANTSPTVNAGEDKTVSENSLVTLSGVGEDTDGSIVKYTWVQTSGASVELQDSDKANASFIAPSVSKTEEVVFMLTVTDNDGAASSDEVIVNVLDLPETISGSVQLGEAPQQATIEVFTLEDSLLYTGQTEQNGNYSIELVDAELLADAELRLVATLDNNAQLRTIIPTNEVRDNHYQKAPSHISEYTEAATLLFLLDELPSSLGEILEYDTDLQTMLPSLNESVNAVALAIRGALDEGEYSQSDYSDQIILAMIEALWEEVLPANQSMTLNLNEPTLLSGKSLQLKGFSGFDNVSVSNNRLTVSTGSPAAAKLSIDIVKDGELFYRTTLSAVVGDYSAKEDVVVSAAVESAITVGDVTLQTTTESFSSQTTITLAEMTNLPDQYNQVFDKVISIDAGVQPTSPVLISIPVESNEQANLIRLSYVNPQDDSYEVYKPVSYDAVSKLATFSIDHFSLFGFFYSDSPYTLATTFTPEMVRNDTKGVFQFVRDEIINQLIGDSAIEELQSCTSGSDEYCENYIILLSSKALSSFLQFYTNEALLREFDALDFRYTLNINPFSSNNALEEYTVMVTQLKALQASLSVTPHLGNGADFFSSGDVNDVIDLSILNSNYIFNGRFHIPGLLARQISSVTQDEESIFSELKRRIETSDIYQEEKFRACGIAEDYLEMRRGALINASLKIPVSSPWSDLKEQREYFSSQWEALVKEEFEGMAQADTDSSDFAWEIINYFYKGLTPLTTVLDSLGTIVDLTKPVDNALAQANAQIGWYIRSAQQQFLLNDMANCSASHCFGAVKAGSWSVVQIQGASFYVPPETFETINTLDKWAAVFEACDFAQSGYEGPGDTSIDEGAQVTNGGLQQGSPDTPPQTVTVTAKLQVSGELELGRTITLDASQSEVSSGTLAYQWQVFGPTGSAASPANDDSAVTTFTIDSYGAYTVALRVLGDNASAFKQYRFSVVEQNDKKLEGGEPRYIFGTAKAGRAGNKGQDWVWEVPVNDDVSELIVWLLSEKKQDDGLRIAVRVDNEPTVKCTVLTSGTEVCHWDRADFEGKRKRNREVISLDYPESGTYFIKAHAFEDFDNVTIFFQMESDRDKDNDGVPNANDAFPLDSTEQYDSDNDGVGDNADAFPNDKAASVDADMDGEPDSWNSGYNETDSTTGLVLDFAVGVRSIRQNAGTVSVDNAVYILPLGGENALHEILEEPQNGNVQRENDTWLYIPNAGFTGRESFIYQVTENDGTILRVLVNFVVEVNTQPPGPTPEPEAYEGFVLTTSTVSFQGDYSRACEQEYGSDWQQADWEDLKTWYNDGGNLAELVSTLGLTVYPAWIRRDGHTSFADQRDYFIEFHDGNLPTNFLAHDDLSNFYLSLGSWTGERVVICRKVSDEPAPSTHQFDGLWSITGTTDEPSSTCGTQLTVPLYIKHSVAVATHSAGGRDGVIKGTINNAGVFSGEFSSSDQGVFGTIEGSFDSSFASGTYLTTNPACRGTWTAIRRSEATGTDKLNDTGIVGCASDSQSGLSCPVPAFLGQDAEYGRDALAAKGLLNKVGGGKAGFDFTKLDKKGSPLPENATSWSCVKDNHTGLIWEVKQNTVDSLQDNLAFYYWYSSSTENNGGSPGVNYSVLNTEQHTVNVNNKKLCGFSDWRLPSRNELRSIVDYGAFAPAIDTNYFPNTMGNFYWTSDTDPANPTIAWIVNFEFGQDDAADKTLDFHVRLVSSGQ